MMDCVQESWSILGKYLQINALGEVESRSTAINHYLQIDRDWDTSGQSENMKTGTYTTGLTLTVKCLDPQGASTLGMAGQWWIPTDTWEAPKKSLLSPQRRLECLMSAVSWLLLHASPKLSCCLVLICTNWPANCRDSWQWVLPKFVYHGAHKGQLWKLRQLLWAV